MSSATSVAPFIFSEVFADMDANHGAPARGGRGLIGLAAAVVCLAVAGTTFWTVTRTSPSATTPAPSLPAARPLEGHEMRFGPIRPVRPMPAATVTLDDGTEATLAEVLDGRWTLLQLMFTSCSTTCPIQGAIYQRLQDMIAADDGKVLLLSLSIDPAGDSARAMRSWLDTYEAGPNWRGVIPAIGDLDAISLTLNGAGEGVDVHDARIYFIDPDGNLVYASEDMAPPETLYSLSREALAGPPGN
jgi:protein SCO1/2